MDFPKSMILKPDKKRNKKFGSITDCLDNQLLKFFYNNILKISAK